jgi:F-type H+-transporting ATPase subunit delta
MATVNDRELALARVYSKAILDLAEERGESEPLLDELQEVVKYLDRTPELERFLASPLVEEEERAKVLEDLFRGRASDLLVDALQIVSRKGRAGLLRAIAEGYRIEYRALHGLVDAHVRTAVPLGEPLRAQVRAAVARFTGKQPYLIEKVDPALIGGIVIEAAGQKVDGSVASRLRELGHALELRASQQIVRSRESGNTAILEDHP